MRTRHQVIELANSKEFDVIVLGAGIVGAGIAQNAAAQGLSVLVLDKNDFASGTSSRTTKLIHGGLRYLENWQFRLTRQLCQERSLVERLAPHLVKDTRFLLPLVKGRPLFNLKAHLGLSLYDALSPESNFGQKHNTISREQVLERAPTLAATKLLGGLTFHDAVTDDARLVIEVLKSACQFGAQVLNYVKVIDFEIIDGQIRTVICQNRYDGKPLIFHSKSCINATGIWSDELMHSLDSSWKPHILPAKGTHIVLPGSAFDTSCALLLPSPALFKEQRYIFVIPWQRALLVGTTDTAYSGSLDHPMPQANEIDYLLSILNHYAYTNGKDRQVSRADIIASWSGLRPLVQNIQHLPHGEKIIPPKTTKVSREHAIIDGPGQIISAVGGKLTNYRLIAEQVMSHLLGKHPALAPKLDSDKPTNRSTAQIMLGGWLDGKDYLASTAAISTRARTLGLEPSTIDHLISTYGKDTLAILTIIEKDSQLNQRICPDFPPVMAEIPFCIEQEMAICLEDVLARRLRLSLLHQKQCLEAAPKVAKLMQSLLSWDNTRLEAELMHLQSALSNPNEITCSATVQAN